MERYIGGALSGGRRVCPRCGRHYLTRGTVAAKRYGVCETCYFKAKAAAMEDRAAALKAETAYDAKRQDYVRQRRKLGPGEGRERVPPKWD